MSLPFRTDFGLAGVRCLLSTNSHNILRQTAAWKALPSRAYGSTFQMEIFESASFGLQHAKTTHFRGSQHLVFAMIEPGSLITYDLLRKEVRGVFSSEAAQDATFWKSKFLPITIGILGTTLGVAPLHCACLALNGKGVLIAADSGAGKSTLTAALAARGFSVVSDDWTYLSRPNQSLIAEGLSAPIKLLPDAARFFPELGSKTPIKTLNGEVAYEVPPGTFHSSAPVTSCTPELIFFLKRTSLPGTQFSPSQPHEVRNYFESNAERLPEQLSHARDARSGLINCLSEYPSWSLRTGEGPQKTAEAVEQFLTEVHFAA